MTAFTPIDLSQLPAPEVIKPVNFDALLDDMKAAVIRISPDLEPILALESEPVTQVLRVCAYSRMLDRLEFNDGAKANMLALSTGTNLDGLAAFWGVQRLIIQAANDTVSPPIAEIKEGDDAFRSRIQLSLEAHTTAGSRGAYRYFALSADGGVKDATVQSPAPGKVVVNVLSHDGDGTPSNILLNTVKTKLHADDVRPLTDQVTVRAATIIPYRIEADLTLNVGPDAQVVLSAIRAAVETYITQQHKLGHDINRSGLFAALHQSGVQKVDLVHPDVDIKVADDAAAFCPADKVTIKIGGKDV